VKRGEWATNPGVSMRVSTWEAGKDVRTFLHGRRFSRRLIRRLAVAGSVRVDGLSWTSAERPLFLRAGQRVDVAFPPPSERHADPVSGSLAVAYEDEDVLVVDKPPGLLAHPLPWERGDNLLGRVYAYLLSTRGPQWYPHLVHRLDRPTSGLVLVALHPWAKHVLSRFLAAGRIRRTYASLLAGDLPIDAGMIEAPIRRRADSLFLREIHPEGRTAQTYFKVVKRCRQATWVQALLGSGRTHQIRVHFAAWGYPVLGDDLYGTKGYMPKDAGQGDGDMEWIVGGEERVGLDQRRRIALHAEVLRFPSLCRGEERMIVSPVPSDFRVLWERACVQSVLSGEGDR